MDRPEFCTDEQLEFLDNLREDGRINMFGAGFLLDAAFPELREGKLFERVGSSISSPRAKIERLKVFCRELAGFYREKAEQVVELKGRIKNGR